jgi:hypothetical protein
MQPEAVLPRLRSIAPAVLIGLTAGAVAGCGASTAVAPATIHFVGCPLGPPWPLPVAGGSLAELAVEGMTCQFGKGLMTLVIRDLDAGKGTNGYPVQVTGWNCVSYNGNQMTCLRGRAMLYGQYGLS